MAWARQPPRARKPLVGVLCCNEVAQRPIQAVATRFVRLLAEHAGACVVLEEDAAGTDNSFAVDPLSNGAPGDELNNVAISGLNTSLGNTL